MRTRRPAAMMALMLAVLAAATAASAAATERPGANENPRRAMFRLQTFGACMSANQPHEQYDPEDRYRMPDCECAADRYMGTRDLSELRLVQSGEKGVFDELLASCRAERHARAGQPAVTPTPPADAPVARGAPAPAPAPALRAAKPAGPGLMARIDAIGVPRWAWPAIGLLVLLLLWMLLRRSAAKDLMAPPRSMRHDAFPPPPPPPG